MLENDIAGMGGDAVILQSVALDRAQEDKVLARFKADRDDAYREFIDKCDDFDTEIATKPPHGTSLTTSSKRTTSS